MSRLAQRLAALETAKPPEDDERNWPWVTLRWNYGEPEPVAPPRHNVVLVRLVAPSDPPEWRGNGQPGATP